MGSQQRSWRDALIGGGAVRNWVLLVESEMPTKKMKAACAGRHKLPNNEYLGGWLRRYCYHAPM
jgi:hypothetical protein